MRKITNLNIAIARAATAIQYMTWSLDAESPKDKENWRKEALHMLELAIEWLNKK